VLRPRFLALCAACAGSVLACGPKIEEVHKPAAPDLTALIADYREPDGELDDQTAQDIVDYGDKVLGWIQSLGVDQTFIDSVTAGLDSDLGGGSNSSDSENVFDGDGYLRITRICNGWGSKPVPDRQHNGEIRAVVGFTEAGLDPVLWGTFDACRYLVGGVEVEIDQGTRDTGSDLSIYLGENPVLGLEDVSVLLFNLDLATALDGHSEDVAFSFRIDRDAEEIETLLDTSSGKLVLLLSEDGLLGVRAKNGDFVCDVGAGSCDSDSSSVPIE
jgi:hypothetical protein